MVRRRYQEHRAGYANSASHSSPMSGADSLPVMISTHENEDVILRRRPNHHRPQAHTILGEILQTRFKKTQSHLIYLDRDTNKET
jgi:hypothetical protein